MNKEFKSCCFTGYRPEKFPFPMDEKSKEYRRFENKLIDAVFSLPEEGCYTFYTGGATGFDIVAAEVVLLLKESCKSARIESVLCIPFAQQAAAYTPGWKNRYKKVFTAADQVILLSDKYYKGCFQKRNEFMVDNSDFVITWYDGKAGGTRNTLRYAQIKQRRTINLNEYGVHEYYNDEVYQIIGESD